MKKGICAYCGRFKELTKEHIFPKFLYESLPEYDSMFFEKSKPKVRSYKEMFEPKIPDVCEDCNNNKLSRLDSYASKFIKKYCLKIVTSEPKKIFYNYNLLFRWLLKVSYNSARMCDNLSLLLEVHCPYILTGLKEPDYIAILAGLIKSSPLSLKEKMNLKEMGKRNGHLSDNGKKYILKIADSGYFPHEFIRITNSYPVNINSYPGILPLKHIAIKSFSFLILDYTNKKILDVFINDLGYVRLSSEGYAEIPFCAQDAISSLTPHFLLHAREYKQQLKM